MNPTVFKITKNQRVLAEALESIDRELTVFDRKLSHIDDVSDDVAGRVLKEELHRKAINNALQTLTNAVRSVRREIFKLTNPEVTILNLDFTRDFQRKVLCSVLLDEIETYRY